ncbi:MAG: hypothetical protein Q4G22_09945 [Paracoccus sp. (in: a-proteobacteria)]|uniref:hypothetical protein n=1 Tax=Paracoccus sp. TaxID=267 RepID=UPI0026DFE9CF|nr:hypothetical protein [Paracoccus sp. (in: a-proteobacteria)]MDO5632147.1 hypothetical protein [Paracoccus sp. (in: a-proteobacteria)]
MRVVDDKMTEIGRVNITDTIARQIVPIGGATRGLVAGHGELIHQFSRYYGLEVPMYIAVAAVSENGEISAWSEPAKVDLVAGSDAITPTPADHFTTVPSYPHASPDVSVPKPTNVTVQAVGNRAIKVNFAPALGLRHVVAMSWHPSFTNEEAITVDGDIDIELTDFLVVRTTFVDMDMAKYACGRMVHVESFNANSPGVPSFNQWMPKGVTGELLTDVDGTPFGRIRIEDGVEYNINAYVHQGTDGAWYPILDPARRYRWITGIRAQSPTTARFQVLGSTTPRSIQEIGTDWSDVEIAFGVNEPRIDGTAQPARITLTGPCVVDLRRFAVFEDGTEYLHFREQERRTLLDGTLPYLRIHSMCKSRPRVYIAADALHPWGTNARGYSFWAFFNSLKQLKESLEGQAAQAKVGRPCFNPWIQIEPPHARRDELRTYAGWLCTTYDASAEQTPEQVGAKMRVDAGQVEPWQDVFETIMIEMGNEPWNNMSAFFYYEGIDGVASGGKLNGMWLQRFANIMEATPGYNPDKFRFYLNGTGNNPNYIPDGLSVCPAADYTGFAYYIMGWDVGMNIMPDSRNQDLMAYQAASTHATYQSKNLPGTKYVTLMNSLEDINKTREKKVRVIGYEYGPGYETVGGTIWQERSQKSKLLGNSTLDVLMTNASLGNISDTFFTVSTGRLFRGRTQPPQGGAYAPSLMWQNFVNEHLLGKTTRVMPVKGASLPGVTLETRDDEGNPAPGTSSLAARFVQEAVRVFRVDRKDGSIAFVLISTDTQNMQTMKLGFPPRARRWTKWTMEGDMLAYNQTLATKDDVRFESQQMPDDWGGSMIEIALQPGTAEVYIESA